MQQIIMLLRALLLDDLGELLVLCCVNILCRQRGRAEPLIRRTGRGFVCFVKRCAAFVHQAVCGEGRANPLTVECRLNKADRLRAGKGRICVVLVDSCGHAEINRAVTNRFDPNQCLGGGQDKGQTLKGF